MTRCVTIFALAWILVGCRAPTPSFNVLAPYGSATVAPPRTGAVGTGGTYYAPAAPGAQPSTTGPVTTTPSAVLPPSGSSPPAAPPVSYMGGPTESRSDTTSDVAPASFQPGSTGRSDSATAKVSDEVLPPSSTPPSSNATSTLQLNGMRVNDATKVDEPKQFNPSGEPVNIANLPPANSNEPSFLRFISPKAATGSATGTPTPAAPPSGAWQSR